MCDGLILPLDIYDEISTFKIYSISKFSPPTAVIY